MAPAEGSSPSPAGAPRGGDAPRAGPAAAAWRGLRSHPVIAATMLGCTLLGAVLGYEFLGEEWSLARRLLAGAIAGAGTGFLVTATKML